MKKFFKEFKAFIFKGNIMDLAVAVVIGAAFTQIINSLVNYIINPLINMLIKGIKFDHLVFEFRGVELQYGLFLNAVLNFIVIGFALFLVVKMMMNIKKGFLKEKEAEPEAPKETSESLLKEIRDLLKEKNN